MQRGRSGERYILAGENLSLREVFNCIADEAGVTRPWLPVPAWALRGLAALDEGLTPLGLRGPLPSERALVALMYHWYDSTKARTELGYSTRPAREAIASSVRWMSEQGLLEKK
jgi:dihydroflavonol-4-reductase